MIFSIYSLTDPRTDEVHYIGKTMRPQKRWASNGDVDSPVGKWVHGLRALSLRPRMQILEECDDKPTAIARECWWMERFWWKGEPLLNVLHGEGKGAIISPMSSLGDEHRAKLSAAKLGHPTSAETRAKIGAAARARSPEVYAKIARANRGRTFSSDQRANLSAAAKRRWADPEKRARLMESLARARHAREKLLLENF
jgi:hypothetical protein